ncbi:hypothetical protein AB0C59_00050 [Streptomyces sp. NPDC048664]|uniref:hypothetical protein n=1 Tax=Streptomyces sp. NPDC048664 TaxID=3154505 RepID=UPI003443120D
MARHASPKNHSARRTLAVLATAGAALGAGAATASAADAPSLDATHLRPAPLGGIGRQSGLSPLTGPLGYAVGPVAGLKPNPLAGTGVDPLDNGVGTQLADFKPLSSRSVTHPVAEAPSFGSLPVLGSVLGAVH